MKKVLFFVVIIATIVGCQNGGKYENKALAQQEMIITADSSAVADSAVMNKVIKTADMRFRVKDVQSAKEKLTAEIKAQGGTIAEFSIQSVVQESDKVKYTLDSLKEITSYRKEGMMVAKVPSEKLDDFTNVAVRLAVFVDHQSMKMDDQSMAYFGNQLKLKNRETALKSISQLATKKGNDVETSLYIGDDYIDKKVENMSVDQKVKFSTITFSFYQENTVQTIVVGNDRLQDYGPGFFKQVGLNIASGWSFFKTFILLLIGFWPIPVFGLMIYVAVKFFSKKKKEILLR